MRILVTGCAGFIGSHLTETLLNQGFKVYGIDNLSNGKLSNISFFNKNTNFIFLEYDINEIDKFEKVLDEVDVIYHLAALADIVPSIQNPKSYFNSNVNGTFNLIRNCENKRVKKIIYAASSSCYGIPDKYPTSENSPILPQYPYALTKRLGEEIIFHFGNLYKIPVVSLRLFNVYGPRARTSGTYGAVFGVFLAQKLAKKPFTVVGDGEQTRDFTFVDDVVNAFIEMMDTNIKNEIFNVGSGKTYSVNTLINLLGSNKIVNIPKRPGEPDCTFADISKILKKTSWKPKISFEDGVKKLMESIDDFKDAPVWDPLSIENQTKDWFKYLS
ncbi:MAG: GDP-mannose 4,6-dehydratase [Alphaproteobacteria bacterium]